MQFIQIAMTREFDFRPVIQPGPLHGAFVHAKPRHPDDVQRRVRRRTQARNVAGVWWDLWFDKRDFDHAAMLTGSDDR